MAYNRRGCSPNSSTPRPISSSAIGSTPIEVVLDGESHTATVPLEMVAHFMVAGTSLTLQLVATTVAYGVPRLGGSVTFDAIDIALPVMKSATANAS